ncbi:MAG: DUF2066 domain-containing protein [Gammaproteobacteria bacterium]|nr:DUF2066 domain-containing protein [Gammaproteobacteria bacterium]MDH5734589.1 DUF2066 domain-containing protein [Gammaproteobacteria bacterium]
MKQLFETSLPVVSQDRDIRQAAFEQGFFEVLVRVSGSSQAPSHIDISTAAHYVQQYRYLVAENRSGQVVGPGQPEVKRNLWIQFSESKIRNLLTENGLSIWGDQRPPVLLWLSVKDGRNRYILRNQDISVIKDAVEKAAKRRGLPIVWPSFDETDQKQVTYLDVWGQFWGPVVEASKRYSVDTVMLCRMNWDGVSWQVDWSLMLDKKLESWRFRSPEIEQLMVNGIDFAADQVASRFAVVNDLTSDGKIIIHVNGIQQLSVYSKVMHYLSSITSVKQVFPTEVNQNWVRFHVDMSGEKEDIQRIIALGKVLVPDSLPKVDSPLPVNAVVPHTLPATEDDNLLIYKFNQ